jgi:hypothetical protein
MSICFNARVYLLVNGTSPNAKLYTTIPRSLFQLLLLSVHPLPAHIHCFLWLLGGGLAVLLSVSI